MALFRCNKCGHLREVPNDYIGKSVKCPQCKEVAPIHDTVAFIKNVIEKYQLKNKELQQLKQEISMTQIPEIEVVEETSLEPMDIYNTTALTQKEQYLSIIEWFQTKQIQIAVDQKAI